MFFDGAKVSQIGGLPKSVGYHFRYNDKRNSNLFVSIAGIESVCRTAFADE